MYQYTQSPEDLPEYPSSFAVSSNGPSGTLWAPYMGIYQKNDSQVYHNRAFYELDLGGVYLFYYRAGYWVIGPTIGGAFAIATQQKGLLTPPSTGWQYVDNNYGQFKEDPHMNVSGETLKSRDEHRDEQNTIFRCSPIISSCTGRVK